MPVKRTHVAVALIVGTAGAQLVPAPTFTAHVFQTAGLLITSLANLAYQERIAQRDQQRRDSEPTQRGRCRR